MERDISAGGVTAMIPGYDTADVSAFQRKMLGSYVAAPVCVGGVMLVKSRFTLSSTRT